MINGWVLVGDGGERLNGGWEIDRPETSAPGESLVLIIGGHMGVTSGPVTVSPLFVTGQNRCRIRLFWKAISWAPNENRSARPESILFGHAEFSILYAASKSAPVRASVAR